MFEYFQGSEEEFYTGANDTYNHVYENHERFGSPDPAPIMKAKLSEYNTHYAKTFTPYRSKADTALRNAARAVLETLLRDYGEEYLFHNHRVTLEDRIKMRIHTRKAKTAKPVPTTIPIVVVILAVIRQITFKFYKDAENTKRKHPGKPRNVDAFVLYWAILDHEPMSLAELINRSSRTSSPLTLTFSEADRGKRLYYVACWQINRDRLEGPTTDIRMVIIP